MNNLQSKIDVYLSGNPTLSREIIFQASQMFNEKLTRFNHVRISNKKSLPSLSQIGKPMCQLQAAKLGWKQEAKPNHFKIMMTYGDMTEVVAVSILLAAGIKITDLNKKVKLPTKSGDLYGELDLVIEMEDKTVWDIKSASSYSYDSRFASYQELKRHDDFGYCCQLFGYAKAEGVKVGGWIILNKGTGEMKVIEADPDDEAYFLEQIENKALQISKTESKEQFQRLYDDAPETYYKKITGNRKLQRPCTFCDYKFDCWKGLKYVENPVSKAKRFDYYTKMSPKYEAVVS
jgi:hypothetical protein|tara:strand:- start:3617 stop:4486 length:870 start_codon:yes stop_codon:yes gene_type:complete